MHLQWKDRPVFNRKISEDSVPSEDKKEGLILIAYGFSLRTPCFDEERETTVPEASCSSYEWI